MSDRRRLDLDELLASAAGDDPSDAAVERLTARLAPLLGPMGGPPPGGPPPDGGAGAAGGTGAGAAGGALGKWLAGAVATAVAVGGGYFAYRAMDSEPPRRAAVASAPLDAGVTTASLPPDAAPAVADAAPTQVRPADRPPAQTPEEALAEEARLLGKAQSALGRGDARGALRWIERHARRHPGGTLAEERERLAIEALLRAGRRASAEARARSFHARYPRSVQWPRIRELLDEPDR
jgi:hypothetical protein